MRIGLGQFSHESNTFSATTTSLRDFAEHDLTRGAGMLERYAGTRHYLGGIIDEIARRGHEAVPLLSASMTPSGTIEREAFERILAELLEQVASHELDALCLALHGGAVAEGYDDPEGALLEAVRRARGSEFPVVATLDLHANVTRQMVANADCLFGVHYFPHTDQYERGAEAVAFLTDVHSGSIEPVSALVRVGMIVPASKQRSSRPEVQRVNERAWSIEAEPGVLDCTVFWGFPFADIPHTSMSVLVTCHRDAALAEARALEVAQQLWAARDRFRFDDPTPERAVAAALAHDDGPVVIADTADNPGGGGAGDGTTLLRALLDARVGTVGPTCFGVLADPEVVRLAHEAGVGATVRVRLGGKTDDRHGPPLDVSGLVRVLSDGRFRLTSPMSRGIEKALGRMVRMSIDGIDVLVSERRDQVFDDAVFRLHGIDPSQYRIVALKSSLHFHAGFDHMAKAVYYGSGDGITTHDFTKFGYTRVTRPLWPLDEPTEPEFSSFRTAPSSRETVRRGGG